MLKNYTSAHVSRTRIACKMPCYPYDIYVMQLRMLVKFGANWSVFSPPFFGRRYIG